MSNFRVIFSLFACLLGNYHSHSLSFVLLPLRFLLFHRLLSKILITFYFIRQKFQLHFTYSINFQSIVITEFPYY